MDNPLLFFLNASAQQATYTRVRRAAVCIVVSLVIVGLSVACQNPFDLSVKIPSGSYKGAFQLTRQDPNDKPANAAMTDNGEVQLTITDQSYTLKPLQNSLAPPESFGVYTLQQGKIIFSDRAANANPSISLELFINGEYTYTFDGQNLVITQTNEQTRRTRSFFLLRQL